MPKRVAIKTKPDEIVQYWKEIGKYKDAFTGEEHFINEGFLGADASDFRTHCWRCGCKWKTFGAGGMERAHLFPRQFQEDYNLSDNIDDPCNIILLCSRCHKDAPDTKNPKDTFDWIKETRCSTYNSFWGFDSYREFFMRAGRAPENTILLSIYVLTKSKDWNWVKELDLQKPCQQAKTNYFLQVFEKEQDKVFQELFNDESLQGLGVHFNKISKENSFLLIRKSEDLLFENIKETRKKISRTRAKLFVKHWSFLWRETGPYVGHINMPFSPNWFSLFSKDGVEPITPSYYDRIEDLFAVTEK